MILDLVRYAWDPYDLEGSGGTQSSHGFSAAKAAKARGFTTERQMPAPKPRFKAPEIAAAHDGMPRQRF